MVTLSQVVRFHELGGPSVLLLEQRAVPVQAEDEVLIKVMAIGLNRADKMFRTGQYLEKARLPSMLGFEAVGTVVACGASVTGFAAGDMVGVVPGFEVGRYGTYAEHALIPASHVLPQPAGLSPTEAAGLWMAYLTAYGGLVEAGRTGSGDWVAITAASSSVGLAAIQIARRVGARPIAITLTSAKREALLAAGAEAVISTTEESLDERLRALAPDGLQCVFDAVGGPQVAVLADAMARRGTIVVHGALSPEPTPFPLKLALKRSLSLRGFVYTEVTEDPDALQRARAFIKLGIETGFLRPHIDKVFPLRDVVAAHEYLESNQQFGKIVMTV
ncbi:alcohol dehydrogenase [Massilia varians]|uniref:Alcohol dehydrogenase n=1 Tax=Massilia varians TaxID=457921 RepID=A0ABN6TAE0_9BURK|nr:zinc-dependent alcohol dehydrogenase family protein [Massilia varians]BDT57049.1 alcohol dehydrogenase [Massilia varians]